MMYAFKVIENKGNEKRMLYVKNKIQTHFSTEKVNGEKIIALSRRQPGHNIGRYSLHTYYKYIWF